MRSTETLRRRAKRPVPAHLQGRPGPDGGNVVGLAVRAGGLSLGVVEVDGKLLVRFRVPASPTGIQEMDLSAWMDRRPLALAVCDYLAAWGTNAEPTTRGAAILKATVFLDYLRDRERRGEDAVESPADLTTAVVDGYEAWLNAQFAVSGTPWSADTKAQRYGWLRDLVAHCRTSSRHARSLRTDLSFKRNPWPGRHLHRSVGVALSHVEYARVRAACVGELPGIVERLRLGQAARALPSDLLPPPGTGSVSPYLPMEVRLKALVERYGGLVPPRDSLARTDPGLARSMTHPYGSVADTGAHLYFTARALVPFVVLLATEGLFNAEGLLTLTWDDVERSHPVFGPDRWRVNAEKRRSGRRHSRSWAANVAAVEHPVNLLKVLDEFGAPGRALAPARHRDRVFVFWQARGEPIAGFESAKGAATDNAWQRALEGFVADHDLPAFGLKAIRLTGGDLLEEAAGGDIKAQQAGLGHLRPTTTYRHYRTTSMSERGRERLADAMAWRERFVSSGGKADTRGGLLADGGETAATPGFGCFDPLASPVVGQREGRLCNAYGACPACPLAWVDVRRPRSYARLLQVRTLFETARLATHPTRYLEVLQPQVAALDRVWLPGFDASVTAEAARLTLPPLPALE